MLHYTENTGNIYSFLSNTAKAIISMYKYVVWGGTNGFVSILIRMFSFHCILKPENDLFFKTIFHEFFHDFTQMECEYNIELYEKELMMTEK